MMNLLKIPTWADEQYVYAVVETPRGSACKLEFDLALRVFTLAKPLMAGLAYPYDWGFIPSTKAEDGDPLESFTMRRPIPAWCFDADPWESLKSSRSPRTRRRGTTVCSRCPTILLSRPICRTSVTFRRGHGEQFFRATNALEDKKLEFLGWRGPAHAINGIKRLSRK
jgi:inorganic pyrophosphatase